MKFSVMLLTADPIGVLDRYGRPLPGHVPQTKAIAMVRGGRAVVRGSGTVQLLWTRKEFVRYVLRRESHICRYCGGPGDTVDHILPRARGGLSTPSNCCCACQRCNGLKRDRSLTQFRDLIAGQPCRCFGRLTCYKHRVLERMEKDCGRVPAVR